MSDQQERKGTHYRFATTAALTERGGRVSTASEFRLCGLGIARVGDVVTYPDGSEAVIVDGAGYAATIDNRAAALVGSHLSNGDRIIETPWGKLAKGLFIEEGTDVPGLFDANWTPPPREPLARFAISGATTARGGMVREVTGEWEVEGTHRKAAAIGDFVEYADGTRAHHYGHRHGGQ
ncbi:PAAR domain-containing protein [Paraburkholderia sp. J63]|uniref:PAAR domain-containing protein n=1 Tax=Paraburkholderia sp. J63 TaxID=2805434 RepID=UPI002ABD1413|nr:PAAR domain-containing protein [Paraburkholderia sp. J63]